MNGHAIGHAVIPMIRSNSDRRKPTPRCFAPAACLALLFIASAGTATTEAPDLQSVNHDFACPALATAAALVTESSAHACGPGSPAPEILEAWFSTLVNTCDFAFDEWASSSRQRDRASACDSFATDDFDGYVEFLAEHLFSGPGTPPDVRTAAIEARQQVRDLEMAALGSIGNIPPDERIEDMSMTPYLVACSGAIADMNEGGQYVDDIRRVTEGLVGEQMAGGNPILLWLVDMLIESMYKFAASGSDLEPPHDYRYRWDCDGSGRGYVEGKGGLARHVFWVHDGEAECYYDGVLEESCAALLGKGTAISTTGAGEASYELCDPDFLGYYRSICVDVPDHANICGDPELLGRNAPAIPGVGFMITDKLANHHPCPPGWYPVEYAQVSPDEFEWEDLSIV